MTRRPPLRRRPALALALAGAALVGCSPAPTPTPSATPVFASEEEAFAAAEATYRAYVDALNAVELSDPKTFEAVYEHTTGEFQAGDRKNLTTMNAEKLSFSGSSSITGFVALQASESRDEVLARICVDVSQVTLVDESGNSRVPAERTPTYIVDATFVQKAQGLRIASADRSEASSCE